MSKRLASLLAMPIAVMGLAAPAPAVAMASADPLPPPPPIVKPTAHLHGVIKDAKTGVPISGACVDVQHPYAWSVVGTVCTGADGAYRLTVPAIGQGLKVKARAAGYRPMWLPNAATYEAALIVLNAGDDKIGDFALGGDVGSISGLVMRQDGLPDFFPMVNIIPVDGSPFRAAIQGRSDGTFSHTDIPAGQYYIGFTIWGYPAQYYPQAKSTSDATPVTIGPDQPLVINEQAIALPTKPAGAFRSTVNGLVTDSANAPVPNATITLRRTSGLTVTTATTGPDGRYTTSEVIRNNSVYAISAQAPGLAETWSVASLVPTVTILGTGANARNFQLWPNGGTVRGKITDFDGTNPPYGTQPALYRVFPDGNSTFVGRMYTGIDGSYEYPNVPAGKYKLSFSVSGRNTQWHGGFASMFDSPELTVVTGQTLQLTDKAFPRGYIDVTVRNSETGAPLSGTCVYASVIDFSRVCTNADGIARLGPFWFGAQTNTSVGSDSSPYYFSNYATVTAMPGEIVSAELKLRPAATLELPVSGVDGAPFTEGICAYGERIELGRKLLFDICANVQENKAVFGPLEPGEVHLLLYSPIYSFGAQWLTESGGTGQVETASVISLKTGSTTTAPKALLDRPYDLAGSITNQLNQPIELACASVVPALSRLGGCVYQGSYRIPALGPYKWPVRFIAAGYATEWSGDVGSRAQAKLIVPSSSGSLDAVLAPEGSLILPNDSVHTLYWVYDAYTGDLLGSTIKRLGGLGNGSVYLLRREEGQPDCWIAHRPLPNVLIQHFGVNAGKERWVGLDRCTSEPALLSLPRPIPRKQTPIKEKAAMVGDTTGKLMGRSAR